MRTGRYMQGAYAALAVLGHTKTAGPIDAVRAGAAKYGPIIAAKAAPLMTRARNAWTSFQNAGSTAKTVTQKVMPAARVGGMVLGGYDAAVNDQQAENKSAPQRVGEVLTSAGMGYAAPYVGSHVVLPFFKGLGRGNETVTAPSK